MILTREQIKREKENALDQLERQRFLGSYYTILDLCNAALEFLANQEWYLECLEANKYCEKRILNLPFSDWKKKKHWHRAWKHSLLLLNDAEKELRERNNENTKT